MLLRFGVDSSAVDLGVAEAGVIGRAVAAVCASDGVVFAVGGKGSSFFFLGVVVEKAGGSLNFLPLSRLRRSKVDEGGGRGNFLVLDDRGDIDEMVFPSVGEGSGVTGGVALGVVDPAGPLGVGISATKDSGGPVETDKGGPVDGVAFVPLRVAGGVLADAA